MQAIVCDTSSLARLHIAGALDCIQYVFTQVLIPEEVFAECDAELQAALLATGAERLKPYPDLIQKYGSGERAMLSVAIALNISNVLADDIKAIGEANRRALRAFGSLDLLVLAKQLGYPVLIRNAIDRMLSVGEGIRPDLIERNLRLAGEL